MSPRVGSWEWAQATNGRLSRADTMRLVAQGVAARLERLPLPWRRSLAPGGSPDLPPAPDTPLARDAEALIRELAAPELYGHSLRTWAFSALFARREQTAHDAELLYVASLLHDLGLTDAHWQADATAQCFAVEGARAAHEFICSRGAPAASAQSVAEAISAHLNVNVGGDFDAVAQLMSKGVSLDVVGRRLGALPPGAVAAVNARWPRAGSGSLLADCTRRQAAIRPQSRAALLRRLGFAQLIAGNPLDAQA